MEKINMSNDNFIQEENVNGELANNDKKNSYDQPVSQKEMSEFRERIEKEIEKKAEEIRTSESEDIEIYKNRVIKLADLDLESINEDNLKSLNLNKGSLEFIEDSIGCALNEFWRSEKTGKLVTGATSKLEGLINEVLEFTRKHKKEISLGELAIYASSFGPAVLKDLAGDDANVEIYGEKISLKDLADNQELIKTIDRKHNYASPIDILAAYSPPESFKHDITTFSFAVQDKVIDENNVERLIYFSSVGGDSENLKKLESDLEDIGISLKYEKKCTINDFCENKDKIINIFSEDLEIPKEKIEKYIESLIMPDVSNVSVVEFKDFKINKNLEMPEDVTKLQQIKKEIYEKNNVYSENGSPIPENWLKAEKELEEWGKENGYENFDKALHKGIEENNNNPMNKFEVLKFQENFEHENSENFKDIVIDIFKKEGYDIPKLKEIAEDRPEEVIKIISEVMGKNIKYDYIEANLDLISEDLRDMYQEIKHSQGIPYITLESGKGVCHDYGITFVAVKNVLEEEGVPNLEKFVSLSTTSEKHNHLWNAFVAVDPDDSNKIIVSYGDPTWHDSFKGKFNAVDEKHYYTNIKEKITEEHQKVLEKINDYNILVFQEKLKEILTQYNPKQYERDHRIEGNKKLRETKKDIETLQEEKAEKVKWSLKKIREKISKL